MLYSSTHTALTVGVEGLITVGGVCADFSQTP